MKNIYKIYYLFLHLFWSEFLAGVSLLSLHDGNTAFFADASIGFRSTKKNVYIFLYIYIKIYINRMYSFRVI